MGRNILRSILHTEWRVKPFVYSKEVGGNVDLKFVLQILDGLFTSVHLKI